MGDTQNAEPNWGGLKEQLGAVFDQIFAQGRRAGRDEGYKEGLAEGARIERERIRAVRAQALPGHEALIEELANDGVTTGAEAAQKVLAAQRAKPSGPLSKIRKVLGGDKAKASESPAGTPGEEGAQPVSASGEPGGAPAASAAPSLEERCKAEWERDPGVRAEFGTLEAYRDFTRQREAGARPESAPAQSAQPTPSPPAAAPAAPEPAPPAPEPRSEAPAPAAAPKAPEPARKVVVAEAAPAAPRAPEGQADTGREPLPASPEPGGLRAAEPGPSLEDRCKAEWDRDPGVRAEFGTLEAYRAFTRQREAGMIG